MEQVCSPLQVYLNFALFVGRRPSSREASPRIYIVDFFCAKSKLVIEVDGDSHAEQQAYDAARTQWLSEQHGYRVLRFTNQDVPTNIEAVLEAIRAAL